MSAAAEHPTGQRPERTPAAIAAELPADLRAQFLDDYHAALDEARTSLRLDQVDAVIERWWRTVWARRSPRYQDAVDSAGQRGEPVTIEQFEAEFLR